MLGGTAGSVTTASPLGWGSEAGGCRLSAGNKCSIQYGTCILMASSPAPLLIKTCSRSSHLCGHLEYVLVFMAECVCVFVSGWLWEIGM